MNRFSVGRALFAAFLVLAICGETAAWIHAFATCDGHVVKNYFDWPVCIR